MISRMITSLLFFLLPLYSLTAQDYHPRDQGSKVSFRIKNVGFNTGGTFSGLQGKITFDPAKPAAGSFDVSIDAATVNTDNNKRDNHLRSEDYFDVKNHPRIRIVSKEIRKGEKEGTLIAQANLTIRGITHPVTIPFTVTRSGQGLLFAGEFDMNRRQFKVGGGSTIADNLTVLLEVMATP